MLEEIEIDGFFLFTSRREPIPHMQVPDEIMAKRSSLYDDQIPNPSDNSAHRPRQLLFSRQNPNFLDYKSNVVNASHLLHYKEYYEILDQVRLSVPDGRAVWNLRTGRLLYMD
ncbi:hypothetical protein ACOSP7_028448 [Xanthoceras sorbifolium]